MTHRPVPYVDLTGQFAEEMAEIIPLIEAGLARGDWVGGAAIEALEADLAAYLGMPQVVALNSGTDALILGLRALGVGPGDEVITAPNSFIASAGAIAAVGATPVFADVQADQNIDPEAVAAAVTPRTKALMPVHLTGRVTDMDPLLTIAERHGLAVIEDAAQAIGSRYKNRLAGTFGHVGCFSAHPLKNLNAMGDAGFLATRDATVAERVRRLRSHGLIDRNTAAEWGIVSRLDTVQAEILRYRLPRLTNVIARRRANAARYREHLAGGPVFNPPCAEHEFNTFHLFVIQAERRDELQGFLAGRGIGTGVHYPIPIHLQPAAAHLGYKPGSLPQAEAQAGRILSLPIHQMLTEADIDHVAQAISDFYRGEVSVRP